MNSSKRDGREVPPATDGGTPVAYAEAATAGRAATEALERALHDPALLPAALHAPAVLDRVTGETRSRPWAARGVTAPRARRVLDYASGQYLAGYSKVEAGTRWTRSSGQAPHLPLVRQTCRALGLNERSASNRRAVGATYGYLDALGILDYRPGRGDNYAHLAYGPAALAGRSLAPPPHRVSGGIAQHRATPSSPAAGYTKRGSIREEKSPAVISEREPAPRNVTGEHRETSNNGARARPTAAGLGILDALYSNVSSYGMRYQRRLDGSNYRGHGALIAAANRVGRIAEQSGVSDAYGRAVRALDLGNSHNLDKADNLPSILAGILGNADTDAIATQLARYANAGGNGRSFCDVCHAPWTSHDPLYCEIRAREIAGTGVLDAAGTAVAVAGIEWATEVAEMRAAYATEPPLRGRLILDAVQQGARIGYGIPEAEAVALHDYYLGLRAAGTLDATRDLPEVEAALGRPLALAEVALYGLSMRVAASEWEQATSTYAGGAAIPEPVDVREVALAGTAVAG